MAQAISRTGLAESKVELAKKLGCPAFKQGSRVNCDELLAWIKDHPEIDQAPDTAAEAVEMRLKTARAAKAEKDTERASFELEVTQKKYWSRADVAATTEHISQHQRAVLQQKLETELPPKLVGLDVIAIAEMMRATVDEICRIFHDRTQPWTQPKPE
jgi:hypothetical protein